MFTKSSLCTLSVALLAAASLQAQSIQATIGFAQPTAGIAADPLLNRIYVVAPSFGGPTDTLSVINGKTNQIIKNISIPAGAYLPAVNYVTGKVYVATCNSNDDPIACSVTVVDTHTYKVAGIPVTSDAGDGLLGIAVDLVTNKIYVSNASDSVIDVIDGSTNKIVNKLSVSGGEPTGLAINSVKNLLYVPLGNSSVDIFDTKKDALVTTSEIGSADTFSAVNVLTGNVFTTNSLAGPSTAEVIDANGNSLASVPVGDTPYGLDVDPFTNLAFVASTSLNNITVIDGKTNTVKATVPNIQATFVSVNSLTREVYLSGATGVTVLSEK